MVFFNLIFAVGVVHYLMFGFIRIFFLVWITLMDHRFFLFGLDICCWLVTNPIDRKEAEEMFVEG